MSQYPFTIAVDGPAGAGKSTIARMAAGALGLVYVDTGAMYRAVALYLLQKDIPASDEAAVSAAAADARVSIAHERGVQQVFLNGENVSEAIRTEAVGNMASCVSGYPAVRAHLLGLQKEIAASQNVIMDGRDIGTCILPQADLKIFLTASPRVRALRRFKELENRGVSADLAQIEQDILKRDRQDETRTESPLRRAADAILVDSSQMHIRDIVEFIVQEAKRRGYRPPSAVPGLSPLAGMPQ